MPTAVGVTNRPAASPFPGEPTGLRHFRSAAAGDFSGADSSPLHDARCRHAVSCRRGRRARRPPAVSLSCSAARQRPSSRSPRRCPGRRPAALYRPGGAASRRREGPSRTPRAAEGAEQRRGRLQAAGVEVARDDSLDDVRRFYSKDRRGNRSESHTRSRMAPGTSTPPRSAPPTAPTGDDRLTA